MGFQKQAQNFFVRSYLVEEIDDDFTHGMTTNINISIINLISMNKAFNLSFNCIHSIEKVEKNQSNLLFLKM